MLPTGGRNDGQRKAGRRETPLGRTRRRCAAVVGAWIPARSHDVGGPVAGTRSVTPAFWHPTCAVSAAARPAAKSCPWSSSPTIWRPCWTREGFGNPWCSAGCRWAATSAGSSSAGIGRGCGRLILCDTRAVADTPAAAEARLANADRVLAEGMGFLAEGMLDKLFAAETAPAPAGSGRGDASRHVGRLASGRRGCAARHGRPSRRVRLAAANRSAGAARFAGARTPSRPWKKCAASPNACPRLDSWRSPARGTCPPWSSRGWSTRQFASS